MVSINFLDSSGSHGSPLKNISLIIVLKDQTEKAKIATLKTKVFSTIPTAIELYAVIKIKSRINSHNEPNTFH